MRRPPLLILAVAALLLAGCTGPLLGAATPTSAPPTPTATPEPLAATVNGTPIRLSDFEEEVSRYEATQRQLGTDLATLGDYRSQILQALIDRRLLAEGAKAAGMSLSTADLEAKVEALASGMGGNDAMGAWLAANGYSLESLKSSLAEEWLAAQMVKRIADAVPTKAEQIHARQILVADEATAENLRTQLAGGADFAELAQTYSLDLSTRIAGGDLGWFARGTLTTPEVEEAAFALQPEEISAPVHSSLGYHVLQVLERGERPLDPQALERARRQAVEDWLAQQRKQAAINILMP